MQEFKRRLRELLRISAPIILEQVFITVMGLINQMMAANAIGEHAVSAMGIIDGVSNIMIAVFAALTTGGTIIVAQMFGRKDYSGAKKAGAQALTLSMILSAVVLVVFLSFRGPMIKVLLGESAADVMQAGFEFFSVVILSYPMLAIMQTGFGIVRGSGDTATPMLVTLIMNVINVAVGYLLIFSWEINLFGLSIVSPSYGVYGAAIALTIARFTGMVLILLFLFLKSKNIRLERVQDFKPDLSVQFNILKLGIPTSIESSMFQVGRLITQLFIVGMGTSALFSNNVSSTIFGFVNVPGTAFSTGVMILVGQKVGRGEYDDIKKTTLFAICTGSVMFAMLSAILYPLTGVIASLYNASPESAVLINRILRTGLIVLPFFWATSFVTPAALRATGDVVFTMSFSILSMWLLRIVVGYVLGVRLNLGAIGVWYGMFSDWILRSLLFVTRLLRGKWMKKLPAVKNAETV